MKKAGLIVGTIAVAGIVTVTMTSIAAAAGGGPRHGGSFGFGGPGLAGPQMAERMIRFLDLEGEQRDEVRRIVDEAQPELRRLGDAMRDSRQEIRELAEADTLDTGALQTAADEQGDLIADMIVVGVGVLNDVRAVLTPEQLEELEERLDRMGDRKGRRGQRR